MGVNPQDDKLVNAQSGVALRFLYSLLDLKCDKLERSFKVSIRRVLYFISEYLRIFQGKSYDYNEIKITINRDMIANTAEQIDNCAKSKGIISDKTILENHPFVNSLDEELKRIEEDTINDIDQFLEQNTPQQQIPPQQNPKEEQNSGVS
jgi:SPP1 family phage portal protein